MGLLGAVNAGLRSLRADESVKINHKQNVLLANHGTVNRLHRQNTACVIWYTKTFEVSV